VRNLFAHNRDRNPDVKGRSIGPIEIVNNVFYNPKSQFGEFYDDEGDLRINYIGNTALSGPSTRRSKAPYAVEIHNDRSPVFDVEVYVRDNIDGHHRRAASQPDELAVRPEDRGYLAPEPFLPLTVDALAAEAALERVLAHAGATPPARDPLDRQVIQDVINRTGHVVAEPAQAGGWPTLSGGPVPTDADGDGMPDQWEVGHGTDPRTFDAWGDADGNGWADLEDYLNERAAGTVATTQ
jgi:pectate lyase